MRRKVYTIESTLLDPNVVNPLLNMAYEFGLSIEHNQQLYLRKETLKVFFNSKWFMPLTSDRKDGEYLYNSFQDIFVTVTANDVTVLTEIKHCKEDYPWPAYIYSTTPVTIPISQFDPVETRNRAVSLLKQIAEFELQCETDMIRSANKLLVQSLE